MSKHTKHIDIAFNTTFTLFVWSSRKFICVLLLPSPKLVVVMFFKVNSPSDIKNEGTFSYVGKSAYHTISGTTSTAGEIRVSSICNGSNIQYREPALDAPPFETDDNLRTTDPAKRAGSNEFGYRTSLSVEITDISNSGSGSDGGNSSSSSGTANSTEPYSKVSLNSGNDGPEGSRPINMSYQGAYSQNIDDVDAKYFRLHVPKPLQFDGSGSTRSSGVNNGFNVDKADADYLKRPLAKCQEIDDSGTTTSSDVTVSWNSPVGYSKAAPYSIDRPAAVATDVGEGSACSSSSSAMYRGVKFSGESVSDCFKSTPKSPMFLESSIDHLNS